MKLRCSLRLRKAIFRMQTHIANSPTVVPATAMEQFCTPEDSAVALVDLVLSPVLYAEGPRSSPVH